MERHMEVVPHGSGGTDHIFGWSMRAEDDNVADMQEVRDMLEKYGNKNQLMDF